MRRYGTGIGYYGASPDQHEAVQPKENKPERFKSVKRVAINLDQ